MTLTFLQHELKSFWRSKNTGKSIAVRIVMAVLILYLLLNLLVLAFFTDKLLDKAFPGEPLIPAFYGLVFYYFVFDLIMRLQLQELPTLRVQPYLHLPIKRNSVVRYLALTAMLSVFNLWPLVLFTPFTFKVIAYNQGTLTALVFMLSVVGLTVFNNYLALFIKRKANLNGWIFLIALGILVLTLMADFKWHLFSISYGSRLFFALLAARPYLALIPGVLGVIMYVINFRYLKQNLYLEELGSRKTSAYKSSTEIPFLGYFGSTGDLVANEIKLILRNKRPRSALIMTTFLLLYGLIFYANPAYAKSDWPKVFCGMFMTGVFIINYGQFMYSWQASHFDGLMVSKVSFANFLRGKYLLFTLVSTIAFLLTIPYVYFGWKILWYHLVMYLWNIGVNTTIVLFFANRNYKRIDLTKGASFNWEGVGATQLMLSLPLLLLPFVIYAPFAVFHLQNAGLTIMGVVALAFVLMRGFWIKQLEADFHGKKFAIAEGFRNR